jgi:hypothetical protein
LATQSECAAHLFLSTQRFRELLGSGAITRQPTDAYDLTAVRKEYLEHLRDRAGARGSATTLSAERAKLASHQAALAALKLAKLRGTMIEIEAVGIEVESEFGICREKILGIPAVAAQCVGRDRAAIEQLLYERVCECLRELHAPYEVLERVRRAGHPNGSGPTMGEVSAQGVGDAGIAAAV